MTLARNAATKSGALLSTISAMALSISAAAAQEAPADPQAASDQSSGLQDIVVTAQKKSENLQKH